MGVARRTPGKRGGLRVGQVRSFLYGLARLLGDVSAISKGPTAVGRRVVRRVAGRATGRVLRRLFK